MILRIQIGLRDKDGRWDYNDDRNKRARKRIEAAVFSAVGEAASIEGCRVTEVRIAEGRPTTRKENATSE